MGPPLLYETRWLTVITGCAYSRHAEEITKIQAAFLHFF
jgi:hypothetical protein